MKNNSNNNESIVELWGQNFRKVKDGLDEQEIITYVDELMNERDTLLKRQEHLSSLSMLAERTIAEADNVAQQIRDEAKEKSAADAREIITKAEEQAKQIIEEEKAKVLAKANEEAEAIKSNAEREAEKLKEGKIKAAQSELKEVAQQLYQDLLSHLDNLKQDVTSAKVDFEHALSQSEPTSSATAVEENNIGPEVDLETGSASAETIPPEEPSGIQISAQMNDVAVAEKEISPLSSEQHVDYEGEVELEILPPIEMRKIMAIISYLDSLAEVRSTELIPLADRPLVKVSLRESTHLPQMLRALPEIGQAEEVVEDGHEKVQITLTEPSVLDESRRKLNDEVIDILSK